MSKALIFSDLHVHKHKDRVDRLDHCIEVLEWVFQTAKENDCKYIFFLGDLFHERAKIDVLVYLKVFECIAKYMLHSDLEFHLLVGNHDMYHKERWDVSSVKPLSVIRGVKIIDTPTTVEICDKKIDWLPHVENPFSALDKFKENGPSEILFAHLAVHNAKFNICYGTRADVIVEYDNDLKPVDAKIFDPWDAVFLGHYHAAQPLSAKAEYVGSPLQLNFGESFQQKHIIVLDLKTMNKKYVRNQFSPEHIILTPNDVELETYDLNNSFVRVSVDDIGKQGLVDLKLKIQAEYSVLSIDLEQKEKKFGESDSGIVEDARAILKDNREMLKTYVKDKGVPQGLDEDYLMQIGIKCIEVPI